MSLLPGWRARWAVLGAIAGALAVGGIAWADIPDSGVINSCYKKSGGGLRVIDSSAGGACNPSEQPLSWNQTGAPGVSGYEIVTNVREVSGERGNGFRAHADCPPGKNAVGGGGFVSLPSGDTTNYPEDDVQGTYPINNGTGWEILYHWDHTGLTVGSKATVYAVCVTTG